MTSQMVITYILKTILISGIFLAYYWMALRDKKFHYYNRFYLLSASVISLIVPLLNFDWFTVEESVVYSSNEMIQFVLPISDGNKSIQLDWVDYALVIAGVVAITLLSILLLNVIKIQLLKRKSAVIPMDGFDFINTNENNAPFSFLNNLFWKQSISLHEDGGQQIFKHEITHIQQKHTWDRIYCQIVTSIFWMNPFYWIIQKELVVIHEFIADEAAVGNSNTEAFAKMLLQTHYGNHFLNPTHHFFYSSIKRRLTMLTKSTNTKHSYLRRVMVLPILIAIVCLLSIKVNASEKIGKKVEEIKNDFSLLISDTSKPAKKSSVKSPPAPPTPPTPPAPPPPSNPSLAKPDYYINGVKIAEGAPPPPPLKNPSYYLDGVKITEKEMKAIPINDIATINVKGGQTVGKNDVILITSRMSNKVVVSSNKSVDTLVWSAAYPTNYNQAKYSNVILTTKDKQQVLEALEEKANVVITKKTEGGTEKYFIIDNQAGKAALKPTFYSDGIKISEQEMKAISPNDIESINVLKGEQAIKKYPEEGKNGVVEIKLKQKN
jgi:hypothetical protein